MENEEQIKRKKMTFTEEESRESSFYTTQEMFTTKGKTRLRWPPRNILVPLDGEEEGKRILPYVTEMAKSYKSKVILVTIAMPFQWSLATPSIPPPTTAALENHLIPLIMEMRIEGVDVVFGILRDEREKAIKDLVDSTKADLVVIANRYRNPWVRYLKGKKLSPLIDSLRIPIVFI
jgi:nucleotide-binding universal stress UspA family protein